MTRWRQISDLRWQVVQPDQFSDKEQEAEAEFNIAQKSVSNFLEAMENDLDTPHALTAVEALFSAVERDGITAFYSKDFTKLLELLRDVLGINLFGEDISDEQKQLITEREAARAAKDWAASDQLRDRLVEQHIGLRDTATGAIWYWIH